MPTPRSARKPAVVEASSPASSSDLSDVPVKKVAKKTVTPKNKVVKKPEEDEDEAEVTGAKRKGAKAANAKKAKAEPGQDGANGHKATDESEPPQKKAKIPKASIFPPAELDPSLHPARQGYSAYAYPGANSTAGTTMPVLLGAHVSAAGGPATALLKAGMLGANGLALFLKSQRKWVSKDFEPEQIQRFKQLFRPKEDGGLGYRWQDVLVHGSYLINLGNPDTEKWAVSYDCFKDDIKRCHQLGLKLYNWHPGSTVGACTKEESFALIAKAINQVHKDVPEVITVIENMANAGSNIIGTAFTDLSSIISQVEDKSRVKVCIDTCHLFAAGYDIRTQEAYTETMGKFGDEVGWEYLGGVHLNDSKADLGAKKDLHENIGLGKIGLAAFRYLLRDPHFHGIPIILETPAPDPVKGITNSELGTWKREIELLYKVQAMSDKEFEQEKDGIVRDWRIERDKLSPPKEEKAKGGGKKGKKGAADDDEVDEEE